MSRFSTSAELVTSVSQPLTSLILSLLLVSRLNSDIQVIQDAMSTNISMAVRSVVFILVVLIALFILSWQLTLVTFGAIIPIVIFAIIYGKRMREISK